MPVLWENLTWPPRETLFQAVSAGLAFLNKTVFHEQVFPKIIVLSVFNELSFFNELLHLQCQSHVGS